MGLLEGQVAVVTGAANGLGRAIALGFAAHGAAAVVVADLVPTPADGATATCDLIRASSQATAEFVRCDVTQPSHVDAAVAAAESLGPLSVMVNVAGISPGPAPIGEMPDDMFDRVLDVNLNGTMYGCRAAARVMLPRGRGSIINMSSIAGLRGTAGNAGYGASKGAIRLLTYALAAQLGPHGIRVNVLHPGVVETDMTRAAGMTADSPVIAKIPSRRLGAPAEVAGAAVFLASDLASYVNGVSLPVDGGMSTAM